MIRYPITITELRKRVKARSATWLTRAAQLTQKAIAAGKVSEGDAIWSDAKPVFLELQHNKCIYCERLLPGEEWGLVEHDVEHFRPKNRVTDWPAKKDLTSLGLPQYPFPTGGAAPAGYVALAFDLSNYGAACKTCNSSLKADRFPIAGPRATAPYTAKKLKAEEAFLLLPIGKGDSDPETLIGFNGILPFPHNQDAGTRAHRRARVTIDFFRLASLGRESDLLEDRLRSLDAYASKWQLRKLKPGAAGKHLDTELTAMTDARRPHANCVRSYARLCKAKPAEAQQMADLFGTLVEKGVRTLFANTP